MFLAVKSTDGRPRFIRTSHPVQTFPPFFNYRGSEPNTAAVSVSHLSRLRQMVLVSITSSCGRTGGAVGSQGGETSWDSKAGDCDSSLGFSLKD